MGFTESTASWYSIQNFVFMCVFPGEGVMRFWILIGVLNILKTT